MYAGEMLAVGVVKRAYKGLNLILTKLSKLLYLYEEQFWFSSKSWTFVNSERIPQGLHVVGCILCPYYAFFTMRQDSQYKTVTVRVVTACRWKEKHIQMSEAHY
jgi:hypothetical protein